MSTRPSRVHIQMTSGQSLEFDEIAAKLIENARVGMKGAVVGEARISQQTMSFTYVPEKWARKIIAVLDEMKAEENAEATKADGGAA